MKFRFKTALCFIAVLSLAFSLGGGILIYTTFNSSLENEKASAVSSYNVIRNTLSIANEFQGISKDTDLVDIIMRVEDQYSDEFVGICLENDKSVLYRSGVLPYTDTEYVSDSECLIRIFNEQDGVYYMQLSGQFSANRRTIKLHVVYDISEIYALSELQTAIYQRILIAVVIMGAIVSWVISVLLTKPLKKLSNTAKQIAGGNMSSRADIHSDDEFEQLADSFNNMADKLEKNIDELKDAMQRQEKFMGSFAHELKTPMTSIIGYAELLRGQSLTSDERQEASNYIFTEGKRLESLSFKLLDLIVLKKRDFPLTSASPADIIKSAKAKFKNIEIVLNCEPGSCLMEKDLAQSLIVNLIDNAIKAAGDKISITSKMTDSGCLIKVSDNGRGIPEDEVNKITEAFYRVDKSRSRAQGGAGLGLALCAEIVRLHNGTMDIESELGIGTTVTVALNGGFE